MSRFKAKLDLLEFDSGRRPVIERRLMGQCQIAAFYQFAPVPPEMLSRFASTLEAEGESRGLKGLIIFACEGINGTISGVSREVVIDYLGFARDLLGFGEFEPKWSSAAQWPFRKFKVRLRDEIVTLGKPEVQPLAPKSPRHLSPNEWNRVMREEDVLLLDTRNWYETRIGKFTGAIDPKIDEFQEFSGYLERAELPKDKKILIYCTGGIRCEKAIVEMENQGFKNVYQLDGGILNYLAQLPNQNFDGECFVFDNRVAVDQELKPTANYTMCPHCGQPADQRLTCQRCDQEAVICVQCVNDENLRTCSKNCAHHYRLAPGKKGRSQAQGFRFEAGTKLALPNQTLNQGRNHG